MSEILANIKTIHYFIHNKYNTGHFFGNSIWILSFFRPFLYSWSLVSNCTKLLGKIFVVYRFKITTVIWAQRCQDYCTQNIWRNTIVIRIFWYKNDYAIEFNKLWKMKATSIRIIVEAFGTILKNMVKYWEESKQPTSHQCWNRQGDPLGDVQEI